MPIINYRRSILSRWSLGILIALPGVAALIAFGPLNPPGGAVTSTAKTLSEVEPRTAVNAANTPGDGTSVYRITAPGSYYLTGNMAGVSGKYGIWILSSGVTLDLNGFDVVGVSGSLSGVQVGTTATNITVANGSVRGWGGSGVSTTNGTNVRLANLVVSANAIGIEAVNECVISNCVAYLNTSTGINTNNGCTITGCSSYQNGGAGYITGLAGTVTNCSAYGNATYGINATGFGSTVTGCSAYANSASGIFVNSGCTVIHCTAAFNLLHGIAAGGGTVEGCTAYGNTLSGISAGSASTVAGCSVRLNTVDGITCASSCVIRDNNCTDNGAGAGSGAGVHATGSDNRIEGNNCTGADRGVDVDAAGNIIIRNTCSGNTTNWDIVASNRYGPIIDISAAGAAAVSGNAAASTLSSADPNANFTY